MIGLAKGTISNTTGAIFANPGSTITSIKTILLSNTANTSENVRLYFVNNNAGALGTPANTDIFLTFTLINGQTIEFSPAYPIVLNQLNDSIQADSTNSGNVAFMISGQ